MSRLYVIATLIVIATHLPAAAPPRQSIALHSRIDQLISAHSDFAKHKAPRASDAEFVRRVHLDLIGVIPSAEQTRAFLANTNAEKRTKLIDNLLASPEHARHMAGVFDVMLMERRPDQQVPRAVWIEFLRTSLFENKPWDVIAREVLSGDDPDGKQRHRVKFFLERASEPNLLTKDISRLFLGTNLQCAQCHNHPLVDDYKQDHYYGLMAFVGRTTQVNVGSRRMFMLSEKADGEATFQSVFDPKKVTKTTLPRVPGGESIKDPTLEKAKLYVVAPKPNDVSVPAYSRRAKLAAAVADPNYVPFRRNIANRLWAHMMGRGLVEPLDMDHSSNPPSHPELMELLAEEIAARKFDMRSFLRELALSETYQRSSEPPTGSDPKDAPLYATAVLKPLTPEQLAWSLMQATGLTERTRASLGKTATEATVNGQLAANVAPFVRAYGGPAGQAQGFDATTEQALFLANGPTVRAWLTEQPGSLVGRLAKLKNDAIAEELYLSAFNRLPDDDERKETAEFLKKRPGAYSDLAWSLLASTEFRFNH